MFYYLQGTLSEIAENTAVVDCGGVGYALTVGAITLSKFAGKIGEAVRLYTYLAVREDGVELFGFETVEEKNMFLLLTSVSGVGPKAAISILSIFSPAALTVAIAEKDEKAIARANGIGAKTAARIALDLKDKVDLSLVNPDVMITDVKTAKKDLSKGNFKEAAEALSALGYDKTTVTKALSDFPADMPAVDMIRGALKHIASR